MKRTWVYWLNLLVLQWFCVRLARVMEDGKTVDWQLMLGVVPGSGWGRPFKRLW